MRTDDPRTVYGVYEVPTYMSEARRVDSTWDSERPAIERSRQRSVQVHGRVFVLRWTLNSSGGQTVAAFVDGEPARRPPPPRARANHRRSGANHSVVAHPPIARSSTSRVLRAGRPANRLCAVSGDVTTLPANPPSAAETDRLISGNHHDPHSVLGSHPAAEGGTVVRALRPNADAVEVVFGTGEDAATFALRRVHDAGLFSAQVPHGPADYRLVVHYGDYTEHTDDPYRWLPTLGEVDLHLIGEGRARAALGRARRAPSGVRHPGRQGRRHLVRGLGADRARRAGVRRLRRLERRRPADALAGQLRGVGSVPARGRRRRPLQVPRARADGRWNEKADPMAFSAEVPPATASVVTSSSYTWGDQAWLDRRAKAVPVAEPMSVYEIHLASWRPGLNYRGLATELVSYLDRTGFTHVELLPVAEHPFGGSWGYQVSSYYAPTARFGTPDDFRYLVEHAAPGRIRGDRGLGAGALPQGRVGAGPVRRHAALRAPRPAPG